MYCCVRERPTAPLPVDDESCAPVDGTGVGQHDLVAGRERRPRPVHRRPFHRAGERRVGRPLELDRGGDIAGGSQADGDPAVRLRGAGDEQRRLGAGASKPPSREHVTADQQRSGFPVGRRYQKHTRRCAGGARQPHRELHAGRVACPPQACPERAPGDGHAQHVGAGVEPHHACVRQHAALRSAVGRQHQPPMLDGDGQVVERIAAAQHNARPQARMRHLEVQLMRCVPALVVEQKHGDRLAWRGRLEAGGEVQPATAPVDVEHQREVARVPVAAPTVSVAHAVEPLVDEDAGPGRGGEVGGDERGSGRRQQRPPAEPAWPAPLMGHDRPTLT